MTVPPLSLITVTAAALLLAACGDSAPKANPDDARQVAQGAPLYARHCASCHGAKLQGETPDWRTRKPSGTLPAPPHDASGHTWHHPDAVLFEITRNGLGKIAPPGYVSDMPAFAGTLSDAQIWSVLAYIKSTWPAEQRARQAAITRDSAK